MRLLETAAKSSVAEVVREPDEMIPEAQLRRWLTLIRRPDQLAGEGISELLEAHGRLPSSSSTLAIGQAAAALLTDAIEKLRTSDQADPQEQLPHLVLRTCFLEGAKLFQAAGKLGLSERQLSRERARAISLLKAELEVPLIDGPARDYRPEPIPSIRGFMARPGQGKRLRLAVERDRLVSVQGPAGIGKTSLVAELATEIAKTDSVLWYRFRSGVNSSFGAVLFELGDYLSDRGSKDLIEYLTSALPQVEAAMATRLALKGLAEDDHLLVFDDYHLVDSDASIGGLFEELITRLPQLRIVTVGKRRPRPSWPVQSVEVAPFSRAETHGLLRHLGVDCSAEMVRKLHSWTEGNAHLIKLAASWLKIASPDEVASGISTLQSGEEVQSFLLDNATELLDSDDQAVLEAASVFRGRFSDDALAYVSGRTRGAVLDASLRLVRAYVATRNKEGDSAFFHGSVRDYVYERLDPGMRAELHLRAGSWFRKMDDNREASYHRKMAAQAEEELE